MPAEDILELPPPPANGRIAYGPGAYHFGDLRLPPGTGPFPVVVLVHGGYWRARYGLEYFGHAAAALTAEGYATWNMEYRRIGHEGGAWPGTFEDVAAATDYLRTLADEYPLNLTRVIALGHSAGGHLALWLAARRRLPADSPLYAPDPLIPYAVVSLAGVLDLCRGSALGLSNGAVHELLGGPPEEYGERYAATSPAELLPIGVRQILVHGTEDDSVPYEISRDYAEAARAAGDDVRLVTLQGVGHFEVVDPRTAESSATFDAVRAALG
jgi:acetyl esterase/lipase